MTPAEFSAFVALCKERHGWSKSETARRLGLSKNMPAKYESGETDIPLYVALACAALAYGLPPWRTAA